VGEGVKQYILSSLHFRILCVCVSFHAYLFVYVPFHAYLFVYICFHAYFDKFVPNHLVTFICTADR